MLDVLVGSLEDMPAGIEIPTVSARAGGFEVEMQPPGSKSLTNRALLLGGLARGVSQIDGAAANADDARIMIRALEALGAKVSTSSDGSVLIEGVGGRWKVPGEGVTLDAGSAGTVARFLAASSLLASGPVTIDGSARMRERPIGQLGDVLVRLGAGVAYLGQPGCLPMRVTPPSPTIRIPPIIDLGTTQSSQFVSALLLMAPWANTPMTLRLTGAVTSGSYVAMTLGLLGKLGATVQYSDNMRIMRVSGPKGGLSSFEYQVEPDASSATYFWAAAAMCPGSACRVLGLGQDSLQGDSHFPGLLERMGARVIRRTPMRGSPAPDSDGVERFIECQGPATLKPILADLSDMPDAVMTLAVVASLAGGASILRGVRTLRVKESDRIEALRRELAKVGVKVDSPVSGDDDVLTITPPNGGIATHVGVAPVELDTYDDHRMAMSLSLLGLRRPGVTIRNPRCVSKTYPDYWKHLAGLYR